MTISRGDLGTIDLERIDRTRPAEPPPPRRRAVTSSSSRRCCYLCAVADRVEFLSSWTTRQLVVVLVASCEDD